MTISEIENSAHHELQIQQNKTTHKISFIFYFQFVLFLYYKRLLEDTNMKYFFLLVSCG